MYRNWPAIREIGKDDKDLFLHLSSIKLESKVGEATMKAHPECFGEKPVPFNPHKEN
jgi:hypothetical protein